MILVKLTDEFGNICRVTFEDIEVGGYFWLPYLSTIEPVQLKLDKMYGGMFRNAGVGKLVVSPDAVAWPPPLKQQMEVSYTDNYGRIRFLFAATGALSVIKDTGITYKVYAKEYDIDVLTVDTSDFGDGQGRVLPMAFGTVEMAAAMRIGTTNDYKYWKAGIVGNDPDIEAGDYDVYDHGIQKDKWTEPGDGTVVDNVTYFESVLSSDGTTPNVAFGEMRVNGTGPYSTLNEIFTWGVALVNAQGAFSGYTLDTTYARSPSPSVGFYLTEQMNLLDLLSEFSAFFTHCFYIDEVTKVIYLIDMFVDNGELQLSSDDGTITNFFKPEYRYPTPVNNMKAKWETKSAGSDESGDPIFVARNHEVLISAPNAFGTEETVVPYTYNMDDIKDAVIKIGILKQAPTAVLAIPYDSLIVPGQKLYWTDTAVRQTSQVQIRARVIQYNPGSEEYKVEGNIF